VSRVRRLTDALLMRGRAAQWLSRLPEVGSAKPALAEGYLPR
jgi:hypothetical protein